MTWYDMHRCVYDFIRANETGAPESFEVDRYDLSADEREAFAQKRWKKELFLAAGLRRAS